MSNIVKPNIIVALLDAARADHLSCYGYDRDTTPFIDSLAESATLYESAYSNSIWSLPAYASIFSGELPSQHGAVDWNKPLSDETFLTALDGAGYEKYAISPHLLSGEFGIADRFNHASWVTVPGRDLLFEEDPVKDRVAQKNREGGWDAELKKYSDILRWIVTEPSPQTIPNSLYYLYQNFRQNRGWWTDDGAEEIIRQGKDRVCESGEPFFLFMNFIETHSSHRPPKSYIRHFLDESVSIGEMNEAIHPKMVDKCLHEPPTDREREILEALYDAELAYIDDMLESFYGHLQAEGKAENTVFVLLSDHGDLFGEWGLWGHQGRIHNRLCHVPLIIDYPWSGGGRESDVVSLRDLNKLFANIADPTQSEPTLATPGYALTEYFGWDTQLSFEPWEVSENHSKEEWGCYQVSVVTDDRMRLLWDANDTVELYDLGEDPDETTDIAADNSDVLSNLKQLVRSEVGDPNEIHGEYRETNKIGDDSETYGSETKEHLRELGYM